METYTKLQEDIKSKINKARINFKKSPKERLKESYVETRLEALEQQWSLYTETHRNIISECKSEDIENSSYSKNDVYEQVEELYIDYKSELKDSLSNMKVLSTNSTLASIDVNKGDDRSFSVQLPKISIPNFTGKYTEWTSFRDLFMSLVHNNKGLDDVQKLHYLKSHLSGEAEQLLRHVAITASITRFMGQKSLTSESSSSIRELLDTTNECLNALENLNVDTSSWDIIVIYIVSLKLDTESRKLWEVKVSSVTEDLPTLSHFREFLEHRFRSIEFLDPKGSRQSCSRGDNLKTFSVATPVCMYCSEGHKLSVCKKFANDDCEARRQFVQANRLCFNCLAQGHNAYICRQSFRCRICKKKHNTLIHPENVSGSTDEENESNTLVDNVVALATTSPDDCTNLMSCFSNIQSQALLATALVNVKSSTGTTVVLRALLDQGSQASFITESAVQLLGLKKVPTKADITRLGDDESGTLPSKATVMMKVQSRIDHNFVLNVKAYVLNKLTSILPERKVVQVESRLSTLELADPAFDTPNRIDLILGTGIYAQILLQGLIRGPPGTPVAQNTKFGWILSGDIYNPNSYNSEAYSNVIVGMHVQVDENELLKKFWELESEPPSVSNKKMLSEEEEKCERFFLETTKRDKSGRYIVKLPFKSSDPRCKYGDSENIARKRFYMLERKLIRDPDLRKQYSAVIKEYLDLGHAEVVPAHKLEEPNAIYLPHHAVVRHDKTTTKVRVVFDASCAGGNGSSLNDDLMVGPTLQPDLRCIIMRWRCNPICIVADIIKMYRQVKVSNEDIDYQRLLWRENPYFELQHLRLLRVTFGTASAPYLATKSLQQLAKDECKDFALASERVLSDFYVDDLMTGCETVAEGVQIYKEMTELLVRGGFQLQKWSTNNDELLNQIKEDEELNKEMKEEATRAENYLELKLDTIVKILGLHWNRDTDEFQYTVQLPPLETPVTKRRVISDIARLFDPLGWIAPVIITAKVFIQKLWLSGIEWDDELPTQLLKEWITYRDHLQKLSDFRIPRWINTSRSDMRLELQGFCDASIDAYAAVVYTRVIDHEGNIHISLVTSKTKVSPIKQVSVPRLELCGAVLLTKLLQEVSSTLGILKENVHAWTDSSVVLAWLCSHPSRWKTFVGNRVSEILTILDNTQWSHVQSEDNPADCASRGVDPSDDAVLELWKKGPKWLENENINYEKGNIKKTNLEEKKIKIACSVSISESEANIISKFSSLKRLTRVIAYCKRFLILKHSSNKAKTTSWLTFSEVNDALITCIKLVQGHYFKAEMDSLNEIQRVSNKSKLTSLSPYLDEKDILRVGGRLHRADVHVDMKHPVIIPNKSHFTNLLISDAHERTLHGGPQLMVNYLRTKYWIINVKNLVKQFVRKCVTCLRHSARTSTQMMGQLPPARLNACRPFFQAGVDYAGPMSIRSTKGRGHHATKGYICLFVCMVTRAIHLEVVSDMTSQAFLAAFKRFTARRGQCADLWSDNGTTFVGASKELSHLFSQEKSSIVFEVANCLATNGTNWHFIPPHSPNFGGLWEAGVKSTKHHLKRIIGTNTLTFEEMSTVLAQIEACLNSRPISQISCDPEDPYPLTPGHFLVGEPLVLVPDCNYEQSNISSLKRWHLTQRLVQDFWRRWSHEYLTQFHHRYKWAHQISEPSIGDVVLVKEDDLPPAKWLFGIITQKHVGLDNLTRVVSLKCKGTTIKRPISKLIILPIERE